VRVREELGERKKLAAPSIRQEGSRKGERDD